MDDSITVPQHAVSPPAARRTAALPSPREDVAALFAEMKMFKFKIENKQTSKHLLQKCFLHDRRGGVIAASPGGDKASVVDRWDETARHPVGDGLNITLAPDAATGLKKRSGSCSFI